MNGNAQYYSSVPVRRGNVRVAMRRLAKEQGVKIGHIKFKPGVTTHESPRLEWPVLGKYNPTTKDIAISTNEYDPENLFVVTKKGRPMKEVIDTAAHEYAHAKGEWGHGIPHEMTAAEAHARIRLAAERLAARDRRARKSRDGGGEVQVSAYTRSTGPVAAYTRSRPS